MTHAQDNSQPNSQPVQRITKQGTQLIGDIECPADYSIILTVNGIPYDVTMQAWVGDRGIGWSARCAIAIYETAIYYSKVDAVEAMVDYLGRTGADVYVPF